MYAIDDINIVKGSCPDESKSNSRLINVVFVLEPVIENCIVNSFTITLFLFIHALQKK